MYISSSLPWIIKIALSEHLHSLRKKLPLYVLPIGPRILLDRNGHRCRVCRWGGQMLQNLSSAWMWRTTALLTVQVLGFDKACPSGLPIVLVKSLRPTTMRGNWDSLRSREGLARMTPLSANTAECCLAHTSTSTITCVTMRLIAPFPWSLRMTRLLACAALQSCLSISSSLRKRCALKTSLDRPCLGPCQEGLLRACVLYQGKSHWLAKTHQ